MSVPKLRFKEFKEEWEEKKLKDVFTIKYGKDYKHLNSGNIPVIGTGGIMTYVNQFLYNKPSVLIGRKGTIDKPQFIEKAFWTVDTLFYTEINTGFIPFFVYLLVTQINWYKFNEATGVPSLNTTSINNVEVFTPSYKEQTKIADFLMAVDEKIVQLTQKCELLARYKKGVMQQIFSQDLRFKDDGDRDFPAWEEIELGNVLDYEQPQKYLVSSTEYDGKYKTPVLTAGKTFILGYTDETYGIFTDGLPVIIFDDFTTAFKFVKFPFKAKSSAMKILKLRNRENNIKFIYEAMSILEFSSGDEHKRYWISEYSKLLIQRPTIKEQIKVANFLTSIDEKITEAHTYLDIVKQYKQGLLQQMFV